MIAFLAVAALLAAATPTPSPPPPPALFALPPGNLRLSARHIEVVHGAQVKASGGVDLTGPGLKVHAEAVTYDRGENSLDITGGLTMEIVANGETAKLTADSATLDVDTQAGVLRNATVSAAGIVLHGVRVVRSASGRYRIDEASFTPCQCAEGKPAWEVTASRINARPDGYGLLQGGVLRVKGFPILYLPVGFAPLSGEQATGFLAPQYVQSGTDGVILSLPFYVALARNLDFTITPGWDQLRGAFAGGELRFGNREGMGDLQGVYHQDNVIKQESATFPGTPSLYTPDRWYTNDRVTERISGDTTAKIRLEMASDDRYGFDFGPTLLERSRPDYESNIALEHDGDVVGAVIDNNYYQDLRIIGSAGPYNSSQTVSRLAGLDASAAGLPFVGGAGYGLHGNIDARYDYYDDIGSPQAGFQHGGFLESLPRRQVEHAELVPKLVAPLSLLDDAIRMEAYAGGRGDVSADTNGLDPRGRVAPFLGGDASLEMRKMYGGDVKVQHRIGPFVSASFTPMVDGPEMTSFELPADKPAVGTTVEVGITNRIFYRATSDRVAGKPVQQFIELLLYEKAFPGGPRKGETVADVDLRIGQLRLDMDGVLDNAAQQILTAGARAATPATAPEGLAITYAYAPEPAGLAAQVPPSEASSQATQHQGQVGAWLKLAELFSGGNFASDLLKTLTVQAGINYNFITHDAVSVSGGLAYESPCGCWGFKAGAAKDADRPNPTFQFTFDLHAPQTVRRYTDAPGGR